MTFFLVFATLLTYRRGLQVPRKTKRPFWEELNFVADTFKVQSDILQGQAVAGGNYLLQDTILVGDPQLAMQVGQYGVCSHHHHRVLLLYIIQTDTQPPLL